MLAAGAYVWCALLSPYGYEAPAGLAPIESDRTHRVIGDGTRRINSLHNQGIDRTGAQLRVSGHDLDGIVQAIEDPGYGFLLGVQWHPEFLLPMASQRALFRALVEHARGGA